MLYAGVCIAELFMLFLLSRSLTRAISQLLYSLTHNKKITVYILALFFLPGTVVHELAHFFMAKFLFVYAGDIRLFPELQGHDVKLGSVAVGRTDPIRRFLIGAAPFFCGTLIIMASILLTARYEMTNYWILALTGYIVFEIGNTMFSSKKDMEGAIELLIAAIVLFIIMYIFRLHPEQPLIAFLQTESIEPILRIGALMLAIPIAVDCTMIGLIKGLHRAVR